VAEKSAREKSRSRAGAARDERGESAVTAVRRRSTAPEQQVFADIAYQCHGGRWG